MRTIQVQYVSFWNVLHGVKKWILIGFVVLPQYFTHVSFVGQVLDMLYMIDDLFTFLELLPIDLMWFENKVPVISFRILFFSAFQYFILMVFLKILYYDFFTCILSVIRIRYKHDLIILVFLGILFICGRQFSLVLIIIFLFAVLYALKDIIICLNFILFEIK